MWDAFTCSLSKRFLKQRFLECDLSKIFRVCNFGNTLAMTIIFSFKKFKNWCRFRNWKKKNKKKFFYFSDSCIWIKNCKFSQSWKKYLPSAVNLLTLTPKISPKTRGDIFQIYFNENDEKTWQKWSHGDFASIWDVFTCWVSRRLLKPCFLESGVTKVFRVCNFGNILAMTIILFFKMFKIWCKF